MLQGDSIMRKCFRPLTAASLFLAAMAAPSLAQSPVGTDFTYQGKLQLSGAAVTGTADFQFRLFDSSTGGVQIGSTVSFNNVSLVDGLFTSRIDFGTNAFNGDARHLEIAVRSPAGSGSFVILTPRQRLSAVPYALKVPGIDGNSLNSANGSITDALYVNNDGRVGIGTTNPVSLLDLNGVQDAVRIRGTQPYITVVDTSAGGSPRAQLQNAGGRFFITSEAFINGTNGGAFTMYDAQGRIGIGTFSPTSRVEIAAQDGLSITGFQPFITLKDTNAGNARGVMASANGDIAFYSNGALARQFPSVVIKDNDWVGMGVAEPGYRLDLPNIASTDGRGRANRWDTYSSARWKENVHVIDNALDKVMHLRGVTFDWKPEHGGNHDVGFIAEEVGKVVPELVTWEADGVNAQGLAYDRVTALAVEAIKTQQHEIESLKQANAELQAQVAELVRLARAPEAHDAAVVATRHPSKQEK
jgi:Chaperone of endosialidase